MVRDRCLMSCEKHCELITELMEVSASMSVQIRLVGRQTENACAAEISRCRSLESSRSALKA
ncbi:MAG: hypothetical protein MKZ98_12350, partial [Pseudomonadales bacterium]|nr:hypothetical protein [Pseudomonadales bacterium]